MTIGQRRHRGYLYLWLLLGTLPLLMEATTPTTAAACSLDGIASISVNGLLAIRTTDAPTPATLTRWAPFTIGLAFAPGDILRWGEDHDKIRRSLPASALRTPFHWSFGDGRAATGLQVAHRYNRTGWYRVAVWSYWPSRHNWVLFDSARVQILPAQALGQANLGYRIVLVLEAFTRGLAYGGWLVIVAVPVAWRLWQRRRRR